MIRSRRLALVATAVIAGLTVTSCGDPSQQSASTETVASATPPVIQLGAGSGSRNTAAGDAAPTAEMDKMMAYAIYTYVFEGELPALDANGAAWQFPAGSTVDPARIAAIAELFGVEGEVRELGADMGGGWMVGPEDYSGATLTVGADGMLSWWFSPAPQEYPGAECVEVLVDPAEGTGTDAAAPDAPVTDETAVPEETIVEVRCEEPQPPANVPDAATAEQNAKDLFAAMGFDTASYEFETYADEWGANVTGWLLLDGMRAPVTISVGYGAEGAITWASGVLAEPQPVGDYPLVGAAAGLERLNDESGMWMWYGGPAMMARDMAVAESADVDTAAAPAETVGGDVAVAPPDAPIEPACDPAADCVSEEMPPPEEITISFNQVTMGLTQIWDADGTVWLLPAYVFTSADGGEWTVIAVDDSFIQMPEMPEVLPVETLPVDTVVTEPGTDPGSELPEAVDPAAAEVLIGLTEDEATKLAEENGWGIRVARADGVDFAVTADYVPTRVNVELTAGVVTAILSIG